MSSWEVEEAGSQSTLLGVRTPVVYQVSILKNGDTLAGEYVNRVTIDSGKDSAITIKDSIMETILLADTKVVNAVKSKDSKWLGLGIGAVIDVAIFLVLFTLANIPH